MNIRINIGLFVVLILLLVKLSLFSQINEETYPSFKDDVFNGVGQVDMVSQYNQMDVVSSATSKGDVILAITNTEYPVTPGDIYILRYFISTGEILEYLHVSAEYKIDIPNVGSVDCSGKRFLDFKKEIKSTINNTYPYSSPQLEIYDIGHFQIGITGEVRESRFVDAWGLTRLSEIIDSEKTDFSSYRDIEIVSRNGLKRKYDLFKATRFGDFSQDPTLLPGDQIRVSKSKKIISVNGLVYKPGNYQVLEGECLADLINNYADGFHDNADRQKIYLRRINSTDVNAVGESIIVKWENAANIVLENMDRVEILSRQEQLPIVYFEGAVSPNATIDPNANESNDDLKEISVSQKITEPFYPGVTLGEFVRNHKHNFLQVSDLGNAYLLRDGKHIPIDITKYLYHAGAADKIKLIDQDTIIVPFFQYYVTVSGAVSSPGRFPYIPDRSWRYYVNLAGGINPLQNKNEKIIVYSKDDIILNSDEFITPETKIEVPANSSLYHFNQYSPIIITTLSIISTSISLYYLAN